MRDLAVYVACGSVAGAIASATAATFDLNLILVATVSTVAAVLAANYTVGHLKGHHEK